LESISENDARYLLAAYASEESPLIELVWEFEKWDCNTDTVLKLLRQLIEDEVVGVTKPIGDEFYDLKLGESLKVVRSWSDLNSREFILYMTDKGFELWDNDDWGITTSRAKHLMFSNSGNVVRVNGSDKNA
jgi:hypothetical protein